MLPQIRSILIATDMTHRSVDAILNAAELAITANARLNVVHVHEEPAALSGEPNDVLSVQRQIHEKRGELHDLVREVVPGSTQLGTVRVRLGPPARGILDEVAAVNADLIVLGQHRHRGLTDRLVGTTAELVARELTVPCLMITSPLDLPIRKAFVPSDLSAPARRATAVALAWADLLGRDGETEVELAHAINPLVADRRGEWLEGELREELEDTIRDAGFLAGLRLPYEVSIVRDEDAATGLMRRAEETGADLIVIGTHGDPALVRALLGSISSAMVRRSRIPLMLVPPRQAMKPDGAGARGEAKHPLAKMPAAF